MPAPDRDPTASPSDFREPPELRFDVTRRGVLWAGSGALAVAAAAGSGEAAAQAAMDRTPPADRMALRLTVNGKPLQLHVDVRQSLLDVLRESLQLTGTKKGCNQGACGACTVLLDGRRINACLTLAVMHDGAELTTIEGLAGAQGLHPLQAAFVRHEGFQCGYCTSGQIMSGVGCMAEGHATSHQSIRTWMSGNICRCGAYPGVVAAIADVAGVSA